MPANVPSSPVEHRQLITLTTDFGLKDWYVAAMKAVLLAACPDAGLIDVTHHIPPGDILRGSIALERAVHSFPAGTVHLAVVDPGVGSSRRLLVAHIAKQWIICPDNGLITWAWRRHNGGQAYELTWQPAQSSSTFHGRDIMAPAAGMLASGQQTAQGLGRPIHDPILLDVSPAAPGGKIGLIIYADGFGNAITNIPGAMLSASPRCEIHVGRHNLGILRNTYADVAPGEALALIGSTDLLEISVRDGSAMERLRLQVGQEVRIEDPPYSTAELRRLDHEHIWHPFTPMSTWLESEPLVITSAKGMHVLDSDGNRYLDGVSSLWCNIHGHHVPEIDQAIREQLDKVAHSTLLGLSSEPSIILASRLMSLVPRNLKKIFYSDSGATATEIAFKLAVQYWYNSGHPEKTEFISFAEAYHGDTTGAMSVGRTTAFHRPFLPLLFKVHFAPSPCVYRPPAGMGPGHHDAEAVRQYCLAELERILKEHHKNVAALAIEPMVQGAAGMIVQPRGFLAKVRRLASQYGVLFIADEVATGFGRTGKLFACEHENVQPDLMCVAKGITGGYLPLAATFTTQAIFDAFLGPPIQGKTFYHGHTYTGNALACAAAIASIDLIQSRSLIPRVAEKAERFAKLLSELRDPPNVGDIRQLGFMVGVELVADKPSRRAFDPARRIGAEVCMRLRRRGIILRPLGDVIVLMPPLAMEEDDLATIVHALRAELTAPLAEA